MNFLFKRKLFLSPGADHGRKMPAAGLLDKRFFLLRKYKMAHEDSHSTDSIVSGYESHSGPLKVAAEAAAKLSTQA